MVTYTNMIKVGHHLLFGARRPLPSADGRLMRQAGIRRLLAGPTMDEPDPELPANVVFASEEAIRRNVQLVERYRGHGDGLMSGCFSLRQAIVCTLQFFWEFTRLAKEHDALIQMHLGEGTYEIEYTANRTSLRPVGFLEHCEAIGRPTMFAYAVLMSGHEVELLAKYGARICHCRSGNMSMLRMTKIPFAATLGRGHGLGLRRRVGWLSRSLQPYGHLARRPAALAGHALLGPKCGRALRSCRDGDHVRPPYRPFRRKHRQPESRQAGRLMIVDTSTFDTMAVFEDVYYTIVKCVGEYNVKTVLVCGQVVIENHRMLTVDEDDLRARIQTRVPQL